MTQRVLNAPIPRVSDRPDFNVSKIADLARLELTEEEASQFQKQLGSIVAFVDTISSLEVEGVEPTAHPAPVFDCFREDAALPGLERDQFLRNAPDSAFEQIRVPKVVDA